MSNVFDFSDEELDVLAFVLWGEDNSLAMLPPGQFVEQERNVRVVAKLAHEFGQRNREAQVLREATLRDRIVEVIQEAGSLSNRHATDAALEIIKVIREHDRPTPPEPPKPSLE